MDFITILNSKIFIEKCTLLLMYASLLLSFFLSPLWSYLTISIFFGSGYYYICSVYPHYINIIFIIGLYLYNAIKKKCCTYLYALSSLSYKGSKNCLKWKDNSYYLEYHDKKYNKNYIFMFKENQRSNDLIIFKNEYDEDITDLLEPYLGPLQNFHGISYTPNDFNQKIVKVFREGIELNYLKTFKKDEILKLDKP